MPEEEHKTRIEALNINEIEAYNLILVNNSVAHKQ